MILQRGFALHDELGGGADGVCYRASDSQSRTVCVKLVDSADTDAVASLKQEHAASLMVRHAALTPPIAFGAWDARRLALVRPYIAGTSLTAALASADTSRRLKVTGRVAAGLAALHDVGLVHGDLKGAHVIVPDGAVSPVFIDLGFSRFLDANGPRGVGTPAFAAPELVTGGAVSRATDVYALGATIIEATLGIDALRRTVLADELAPHLSREMAALIVAAVHERAELRPPPHAIASLAGISSEPAHRSLDIDVPRAAREVIALSTASHRADALRARAAMLGHTCISIASAGDDGLAQLGHLLDVARDAGATVEARAVGILDALATASVDEPLLIVLENDAPSRAVAALVHGATGERAFAAADVVQGSWTLAYRDPAAATDDVSVATLRRMLEHREGVRAISDLTLEAIATAFVNDVDAAENALIAVGSGMTVDDAIAQTRKRAHAVPRLNADEREIVATLIGIPEGTSRDTLSVVVATPDSALAALEQHGIVRRAVTRDGTHWMLTRRLNLPADPNRVEREKRLAAHFVARGDELRAAAHALRAGDWNAAEHVLRAAARSAPAQAARLLSPLADAALAHPKPHHADALRDALVAHDDVFELERVLAIHGALVALGNDDEDLRSRALEAAIALGAYDVASGLAAPAATEPALRAQQARLALHRGQLDRAETILGAATATEHADLMHMRGLLDFYRGRTRHARRRLRRAAALVDARSDPSAAATIANSRGLVAHKSGDLSSALAHYRKSRRLTRLAGDVSRLPARALNLGTAAQDANDWVAAREAYREAARLAARVGSDRDRVRVAFNLANLCIQIGALEDAGRWLALAIPLASSRGMRVEVARLHLLDCEVGIVNEDPQHARAALGRFAEYQGDRDSQLQHQLALAHAKLALLEGDTLRGRLAMNDLVLEDHEAWLVTARIEARDGAARTDHARDLARRVVDGPPLLAWQAALLLAELAERQGDDEALDDAVATARVAFRAALRLLPDEHVGDYQRVPAHSREVARLSSLWAKTRASGGSSMLERVLRINRKLNECTVIDELLGAILDEVVALTAAERSLALVTREGGMTVVAHRALASTNEVAFSRGIAEQVIASGKAVVTHDAMADERFMDQRSVRDLRMRSIACVPLVIDGAVRGAIYLDHRARQSAFSVDALSVLTAFAEQAALALKGAALRLELLEERRQLELARSNLAAENRSLHSSLSRTTEELTRATLHLTASGDDDALRAKFAQIVARSRGMLDVLDKVQRFASAPLPIFVHGESGAGKELVARALHTHSPRAKSSFVAVNCAAIPNELLESELFGVKRGAFTGAVADRPGLFRVADGGTLFLDEVGDMGTPMQAKLLRVLEEGTFRAVGASEEQSTDVRIVCASHKSLATLVAEGRFREDLYYRLAGAFIELPPLRDRADDIPELVRVLLARAARDFGTDIPKVKRDVLDALQAYAWPGNVRELDNELRRALALADGELRLGHFSKAVRAASRGMTLSTTKCKRYRDAVASFEKTFLADALAANDNDPSRAARAIGISRSGIYAKLRQHRLVGD